MKHAVVALITLLSLVSPTFARDDLSRVRCESAEAKKFIAAVLPTMKLSGGQTFGSYINVNAIKSSVTLVAEPDRLVCKVVIALSAGDGQQRVPGKFTLRQFQNGTESAEWSPFS